MQVKILGGHGGMSQGFQTTSILIDNHLLIDAGSVASTLSISSQAQVDHILISHAHLDHIKDLAFICDNCFGMRSLPFEVYGHKTILDLISKHLFNDTIWPDFTKLPSRDKPTIRLTPIEPEKPMRVGTYTITPVLVNHPSDAMGYIVENNQVSVVFTSDTGPTERIWELAKAKKNLKAIFTEVSFPNKLQKVAQVSFHHTPQTLIEEVKKMPTTVPIILTHFKPNFKDELRQEVANLNEPRLNVLEFDGEVFHFT
jgi:ribonuclease BN (tRNA processing enzyme)